MATLKQLQKTLDDLGIGYETDANKPALEKLIAEAKPKPNALILEVEALRETIHWMLGCGYNYDQHVYWREQKEKLNLS